MLQTSKLSFCTTCMGRLHHLQETYINNIELTKHKANFVLLNYNSTDKMNEWVKKDLKKYIDNKILNYYHTTEPEFFNMAHAKNIAHKLSDGMLVCNLDADCILEKGFIKQTLETHKQRALSFGKQELSGRICISKEDFMKLGGYNEEFIGWGREDRDLRKRARQLLQIKPIRIEFGSNIRHDDDKRVENYSKRDVSLALNFKADEDITDKELRGFMEKRSPELLKLWNYNNSIMEKNLKDKKYVANVNQHWGKATLIHNFISSIYI